MTPLAILKHLRDHTGPARCTGLDDATLERFLALDPDLGHAIEAAGRAFEALAAERPELVKLGEEEARARIQDGFVNFYSSGAVNPYVALAGKGAWVVTLHGAVVHDSGGYGMLGFGHAPEPVLAAMNQEHVMANIMTAHPSQQRFIEKLRAELGHARADGCPFDRFICMNSGSEAMSVATRIMDAHTKLVTAPGARHAGKPTAIVAIERAFHGRTYRPATFSDSTRPHYEKHLASFAHVPKTWTVPSNDVEALRATFARAEAEGVYIEAMFMEPVQGEGAPGNAVTREYYDAARELTLAHDSFLVVDAIQAGLRTTGALSLVDYPGFEDCSPPDMESWSKALNAGQYPLSVLGLTERAADAYVTGIYGNTMTTNPRCLDVACAVLDMVTDEVRANIREQGDRFLDDLEALRAEFPDLITEVHGTGLLFCCELHPERATSVGPGSAEERCRMRGIGIIHGGRNALRFTPHFRITTAERELMMGVLREVLTEIHAEQTQAVEQA